VPDEVEVIKGALIRFLEKNLANPVSALKKIGVMVTSRTQDRFRMQVGPTGVRWPPPMTPNIPGILMDLEGGPGVKSSRLMAGPALQDTGRLWGSINWRIVSSDTVEIGTNLPYAKLHQFGLNHVIPVTLRQKQNLNLFLHTQAGAPWVPHLRWLYGATEVDIQVITRPFIGLSDQDVFDVNSIVKEDLFGRFKK